MMTMVQPKMYADGGSRGTKNAVRAILKKYNHLIKWRNHPSIMEIGYGDGGCSQASFSPYLPSDLKEFIAVDKSDKMIEYAKKHSDLNSMEIEQLDIATEEIPSKYLDRFDHMFAFFVMHMIQDTRQAFRNMHKMLQPGGSIFLTFLEQTTIDDPIDKLSKSPEWSKYGLENSISPHYYSDNPRQEWDNDLKETGFQNYKFFEDSDTFEFFSDEFDNLTLSLCVFLPNIPEKKQKDFKKIFRKLTREGKTIEIAYREGKEIIKYNYKLCTIVAWKT